MFSIKIWCLVKLLPNTQSIKFDWKNRFAEVKEQNIFSNYCYNTKVIKTLPKTIILEHSLLLSLFVLHEFKKYHFILTSIKPLQQQVQSFSINNNLFVPTTAPTSSSIKWTLYIFLNWCWTSVELYKAGPISMVHFYRDIQRDWLYQHFRNFNFIFWNTINLTRLSIS